MSPKKIFNPATSGLLRYLIICILCKFTTDATTNVAFTYQVTGKACGDNKSSETDREGIVQSPNYNIQQYEQNLRCEYNFISKGTERVQLIFTDFDLYHPDNDNESVTPVCRGEHDHLTAYVELNNRMSEIKTFCGKKTPPQLMSSRNQLTLEFVTQTALNPYPRPYKGFSLIYKFVKNFGIKAVSDDRHVCGFIFNSSEHNNGSIYSPNYPGYYPRNTDCHYTFHGKPDEKVRIFFTYFDVEGEPPCANDSKSDYMEFSNYNTLDLKMMRYCGYMSPPQQGMESEKDFFNVTFHSNNVFDRTGFFGYYQFIKQESKAALKTVKHAGTSSPSSVARCHSNGFANFLSLYCIILLAFKR